MLKFKRLFLLTILIFIFIGLASNDSNAQDTYTLVGYQQAGSGPGDNATLECDGMEVYRTLEVIGIYGDNGGFWITDGTGAVLARYWYPNDESALGLQFSPGTYYIFPNLSQDQTSASIKLVFQEP